jgi:hypothetical protein
MIHYRILHLACHAGVMYFGDCENRFRTKMPKKVPFLCRKCAEKRPFLMLLMLFLAKSDYFSALLVIVYYKRD